VFTEVQRLAEVQFMT